MDPTKRKCNCGGDDFVPLINYDFGLRFKSKKVFFAGFYPEVWACKDCGQLQLTIPDKESGTLEQESSSTSSSGSKRSTGTVMSLVCLLCLGIVAVIIIRTLF